MLGLIVSGFLKSGATASLGLLTKWLVIHGIGAALGTLLAFGNPLAILAAFSARPWSS